MRPCTATAAAPASSILRASDGALTLASSQPARILTVTGMSTASVIARTMRAAWAGSRIRLHPALCFAILGTGQPMLTSTMSAFIASTTWAAAAILPGSPPKIWIETGRSASVYSAYSSVRIDTAHQSFRADHLRHHEAAAAPRLTSRRKAVSVIPAMGASA